MIQRDKHRKAHTNMHTRTHTHTGSSHSRPPGWSLWRSCHLTQTRGGRPGQEWPPGWGLLRPSRPSTTPHPNHGSPNQALFCFDSKTQARTSTHKHRHTHRHTQTLAPTTLIHQASASGDPATSPQPGDLWPGSAPKLLPLEADKELNC